MRITSWNVNGVRAAVKKSFIEEFRKSNSDIYSIQETKAQDNQVKEALEDLRDYHLAVNSAEKKGYSGVATLSRQSPQDVRIDIGVDEHDTEGRVLLTEYENFSLINVYVPNSGNGLKRLDYRSDWDKAFADFLANERKNKPIIVTGDFNVAHQAIDLARPDSNYNKTSGYTQVEIDGISGLLDIGLKDAYRELYPEKIEYTFWSVRFGARAKNVGWRIDYFLVDETLMDKVNAVEIHTEIMGSDHCPLSLDINI